MKHGNTPSLEVTLLWLGWYEQSLGCGLVGFVVCLDRVLLVVVVLLMLRLMLLTFSSCHPFCRVCCVLLKRIMYVASAGK